MGHPDIHYGLDDFGIKEQPLFIPEIYRNETREETKTAPPKGKGGTNRPLVSPELQSRQPITIRTTTARAGAVTAPPQAPFFVRPAQPFGPPPASPVSPQRPKAPPGSAQPSRPLPQPPLPQQPFRPPNSQPPLQPPRPPPTPNAARPPTPNQQQRPLTPNAGGGQLRNGMCHQAIFYTPQTVNELDLQRVYTHFALVVSIDQCARTCHEFNCDVAILDPISRHCQFNPSTAFRIHPACPQWPNPLYRNNVRLGQDHIRIACVTCQQRRRIPRPGQNSPMPFNGQGKQQQQTSSVRRPATGGAPPPPQHVIRTTGRDRLNAGPALLNGENSPLRIANAAALLQAAGISDDNEAGRDLSAEFHKLERLLKSAEDYLDDSEPQGERQLPADGGRTKPTVGKEVPSWQEGHPQGEGFSPLRINPLRRPYMEDPSRPHANFSQPIICKGRKLRRVKGSVVFG
uniref:Apple domain-containing protein n=1 Tax=Globodera pallida TaxID=36090 RepID=A0A183CPX4_GLOPA